MAVAEVGFAAVSRAVVSYAADLVAEVERRVVGDDNVRTARGNAWAAICADRARAQARADLEAMVAALAARHRNAAPTASTSTAAARSSAVSRKGDDAGPEGGKVRRGRQNQRSVGSSPRSSASQAALVSTR